MLNVKYVFVQTQSGMAIRERRNALPRAFVVHSLISVEASNMVERLAQPEFDPRREALITPEWSHLRSYTNESINSSVRIDSYQPEEIRLTVSADKPGYLVMSESRYPGWSVFLNGQAMTWFPVNHNFRAVAVPEGTHSILWVFSPKSFYYGAWISGISLTTVLVLFFLPLFHRWRKP